MQASISVINAFLLQESLAKFPRMDFVENQNIFVHYPRLFSLFFRLALGYLTDSNRDLLIVFFLTL